MGHAFLPYTLDFKSPSGNKPLSFSTAFVFAIVSEASYISGHGLAFVISKSKNFSSALPNQYLGLLNLKTNGTSENHLFAVEFDTLMNSEFHDIDNNHVGVDVNSLSSIASHTAGYYDDDTGMITNLTLRSGLPMQAWIDYDGESMKLDVTMSSFLKPKPKKPLISTIVNLTNVITNGTMHVGFSSATGSFKSHHFVTGWSFKMNGVAEALDYKNLPSIPRIGPKKNKHVLAITLPIAFCLLVLSIFVTLALIKRRRMKYAELVEDWELEYRPHRFSYKDLFQATKGFKEKGLLGTGGFGRVYKGMLPKSGVEVAVKKVSHESRHGMKQFLAEIVSIGQLCHRNLVQLLGYCRRKGELLLVYDFMPNGSLDRFLYDRSKPVLTWAQRYHIMKGVASGLLYLHEDWEKVVIHRDIKASNVLLDGKMNGKLGDFGLAKLYDHGSDPQTTHVVGTLGYLAPELVTNGMATTATDTYAFGVFLLEVCCGKRPINPTAQGEDVGLMDWVLENYQKGELLESLDSRLRDEYSVTEVELVLKLGLMCTNPDPEARPSMKQVVQFLEGEAVMPDLPESYMILNTLSPFQGEGFDEYFMRSFYSGATISGISGGR